MALTSLSAATSTFVAGPSGGKAKKTTKAQKKETNPLSDARINSFDEKAIRKEEARRKALARRNFDAALNSKPKQLEFKGCPKDLPFCDNEYVYHPKTTETCEQFKLKFNIPDDYNISKCNGVSTIIKAEDLEKFVGYQPKSEKKSGKKK